MAQTDDAARAGGNLRGIAALSAGMAFLVGNDIFLKLASPELPFGQLVFTRGVIATVLIVIACVAVGVHTQFRQIFAGPVMGRSLANMFSSFFYINALFHLPIANVTSIMQATPLLLTAMAAFVLKEDVGWRRWLAIAIGFCGVLLIVRPDAGGFNTYAAYAVAAIGFVAARDLFTRVVRADVPSLVVTLATSLVVTAGAGIYSLFEGWREVSALELSYIGASAACLVCGYHAVIVAFRSGEIAVVSPFRFSIVVWAMIGGYFIWNEVPDLFTLGGIGLIVAMGAYTFHRERIRAHEERPLAASTRREI
jgi:drug/metabolite transporter (DMT)-like permease